MQQYGENKKNNYFCSIKTIRNMIKNILYILFAFSILWVAPNKANAMNAVEIIENDFDHVSVSINQSVVRIVGAMGLNLQVYNVAGVRVLSVAIDSNDKKFDLNLPKGCYIVKVGKVVRKISVK